MSWNQLRGHADQREMLRRSLSRGRLAHTWLFTGPAGIGKKKFAHLFAQSLLCDHFDEAALDCCGKCGPCRQLQAGSHPDFYLVECPEGKRELPIDLFLGSPDKRGREGLCHDLAQTPMAGRRKIAIIDDADLLNEAGANALLKTLEEPPEHSLIILIASNRDAILPTILSRCQILRFQPLSSSDVAGILLEEGISDDRLAAEQAADLSEGSLTLARALLDPALCGERNSIFEAFTTGQFNSVALARKLLDGIEEAGTETALQRERAAWQVRFLIEFFRELLLSLPEESPTSRFPQITKLLERFDRGIVSTQIVVEELLERTIRTTEEFDQNVSLALCMETLCDDLGKLLRRIPRPARVS